MTSLEKLENIISNETEFNYLVVPINVFNILHKSKFFKEKYSEGISIKEEEGIYFIGTFLDFTCYVDLYETDNIISFKLDKTSSRDNKLENLLNEVLIKRDKKNVELKFLK